MKLAYIANARMPTEKAHGLQIMHMCRAFAQVGHDVTLIVPGRKNWIEKSIWEFYGMEPCFKVVRVPIVDFIVWDRWLGNLAFWLESLWYGLSARRVIEDLQPDAVYSRDPFSSAWSPRWVPHIFEAHTFPNRGLWLYRWMWRKCDRIVTVTDGLKRMFVAQGIEESRLRTASDAVDLEAFTVNESKEALRKKLDLPQDKFLVVYAGHLYPYKGIPDLMEACLWLDDRIRVVVVGGRPDDLIRTKESAEKLGLKNAIFVGRVAHKEVPAYLHASDLAVMPYTRESHHVEYYSSPLKLFEYLAAGRAILTTDLPSVREVLDDTTAEFVPPEDPKALADGINRLAKNPARVAALESHSIRLSKLYTWKNRAEAVLAALPKAEWRLTFYRKYRLEIQLAVLALAIRLLYVVFLPQTDISGGDSGWYIATADWIRGVRGFAPTPQSPTELTPFFPLVYPYVLAAVRSIFGTGLVWIRAVQACFSAATIFLMALMARRWANPYAAWITGLVGAFYVPMILESGIIYSETVYAFFLTLAAAAFGLMLDRPKTARALLAGAAAAVAGMTREVGFYVCALTSAAVGLRDRRLLKVCAIAVLPIVIAFGAIAVRNRLIAKDYVQQPYLPLVSKNYEGQLANPVFYANALSPGRWVMYPVTVWWFFRYPFRLNDLSVDTVSIKQAFLTLDWSVIRGNWEAFAVKIFLTLFHWFILLTAAYGLVRGALRKDVKWLFGALIFFTMLTIVAQSVGNTGGWESNFEPLARYRFPIEPLILIFAATGIEKLSRRKANAV